MAPITPECFVAEHWGRRFAHVRGTRDKIVELVGDLSIAALSEAAQRATEFGKPGEPYLRCLFSHADWIANDMRGANPELMIRPVEIGEMLERGATIDFGNIQKLDRTIVSFSAQLKAALSFAGVVMASCWISTRESGVTLHFDAQSTFVLQVEGTKRWRVSPRVALEWPTRTGHCRPDGSVRYAPDIGDEPWEEVALRAEDIGLVDIELQPGDVLFVPAGTYHQTRSVGDAPSVALHVHFQPVNFLGLLVDVMRPLLSGNAAWRNLPPSLVESPDGKPPQEMRAFFAARLGELRAVLDGLGPDGHAINAAWQRAIARHESAEGAMVPERADGGAAETTRRALTPDDQLSFQVGAPVRHAVVVDGAGTETLFVYSGTREIRFDEDVEFGRNLLRVQRGFRAGDAAGWWTARASFGWEEAKERLQALLDEGVLQYAGR
jgi:ribosomal protein L16 Arg81 hydroxylase